MSEIITFMFEPAKLQMNCASASGAISLRMDARDRSSVEGGLTDTDRSDTRLSHWSQSGRRTEQHHPEEMRWSRKSNPRKISVDPGRSYARAGSGGPGAGPPSDTKSRGRTTAYPAM